MNRPGFLKGFGSAKPPIARDILARQIHETLHGISLKELVALLTNEFEETIQYAELSQGKNTCQRMSLLFNPHRLTIGDKSGKSLFKFFQGDRFADNLARAISYRRWQAGRPLESLLYQIFQWGFGSVFYAHEFPPHIARDLAVKYGCNSESRVLDPCAGWGGRMIGISTVTNYYECFEPSSETFDGLNRLRNFLEILQSDFQVIVNKVCFEDFWLKSDSFDFAITSPPYYDTEVYCDEETNSCNRYSTFNQWIDGFYLPLIQKTMDALKPGRVFILNIGNRIYPLDKILLDNFSGKYKIIQEKNFLSGVFGPRGRKNLGERFFAIRKPE